MYILFFKKDEQYSCNQRRKNFVLGIWFQEDTNQFYEIKTSAGETKTRRKLIHNKTS